MITLYRKSDNDLIEVPIELITFPAGEPHCKIPVDVKDQDHLIDFRFDGMESFGHLLALASALIEAGAYQPNLLIPYFPAGRQDRVTSPGSPFTLAVFAEIINWMNFKNVFVLDPHSPVTNIRVSRFVNLPFSRIFSKIAETNEYDGIICPDNGAKFRAQRASDVFGLPCYQASKLRNPATGKLNGFHCEPVPTNTYNLVVDDICDGGGTFMGLADKILSESDVTLDLYVTHGVFSQGVNKLLNRYQQIITTDSYPNEVMDAYFSSRVKTIEILPLFKEFILRRM